MKTRKYIEDHEENWTGCNWTTQHGQIGLDLNCVSSVEAQDRAEEIRGELEAIAQEARESSGEEWDEIRNGWALESVAHELHLAWSCAIADTETGALEYIVSSPATEYLPTDVERLIDVAVEDWESAAKWLRDVENLAALALASANEALDALNRGNFAAARMNAKEAARIEAEYGDSPTWGGLIEAVKADIDDMGADHE